MKRYEPKQRYSVSKSQLDVLLYLLKYRFLTSDLLAELLNKDRSTIYERLFVLEKQGYITKQYNKTFRIRQRPATYCLAPKGIRYLKHKEINRTQLHYKNKYFTEEQIDAQLLYVKIGIILRKHYLDKFRIYTKYQLNPDGYIKPTPHLKFEGVNSAIPSYFVELFPAFTLSWRIRKRINMHSDSANESDYIYPHPLLIAGNVSTEKRIIKMAADLYAEFNIFTTTLDRLNSNKKSIWLKPEEVDWEEDQKFYSLPVKSKNN
jgi:predicted transcriptional regulator